MSSNAFTPLIYPAVGREDLTARTLGEADGYAEGLRRAARERAASGMALHAEAKAAAREAAARVDAALAALHRAIDALDARLAPVAAEVDATLAEAAVTLAEAVIGHELSTGRAGATDALHRILDTVPLGRIVTIRMNPEDLRTLESVGTADAVPEDVRLRGDDTLSRGDAVAVLADGWLDARIHTALARAGEALREGR